MSRIGALLLLCSTIVTALLVGCAAEASEARPTITMHYSRFAPGVVTVPAGVPVTITLRNDDPIDHEWIVGGDEVHEGHRTGSEPYHNSRPTEVTIPALSSRSTTLTFEAPGDYAFICHLPGHEAYGMRGILRVR